MPKERVCGQPRRTKQPASSSRAGSQPCSSLLARHLGAMSNLARPCKIAYEVSHTPTETIAVDLCARIAPTSCGSAVARQMDVCSRISYRHQIAQSGENWNPKSPENRPRTRRFLQKRLLRPAARPPCSTAWRFFTGDSLLYPNRGTPLPSFYGAEARGQTDRDVLIV
jgi:hypothetical protein